MLSGRLYLRTATGITGVPQSMLEFLQISYVRMHVISKVKLREFWVQHADSEDALNDWYKFASKAEWSSLLDVQQRYPKAEAVPKSIKTEEEYQRALTTIEGMMSRKLTDAETEVFELLVVLIESYEERHYPMGESTPAATLESLMHEFEVEPVSLVGIVGSLNLVGEVIQGQRRISKAQAESLAKFFNDLSPNTNFV